MCSIVSANAENLSSILEIVERHVEPGVWVYDIPKSETAFQSFLRRLRNLSVNSSYGFLGSFVGLF